MSTLLATALHRLLTAITICSFFVSVAVLSVEPIDAKQIEENHYKRIVFLGDSITYDGYYQVFIEYALKLRSAAMSTPFINLGLPSETVSGLSEPNHAQGRFPRPDLRDRLGSILEKTNPDLVFAMYGINEGIYMPFDQQRFEKFQDGIRYLHQQFNQRGIPLIFITSSPYDDQANPGYTEVVKRYANWLTSQSKEEGWVVIDVHSALSERVEKHSSGQDQLKLTRDGIHPSVFGHWLIANVILDFLLARESTNTSADFPWVKQVNQEGTVLAQLRRRQLVSRDAWLSFTGYDRPGLAIGKPLEEAQALYREIESSVAQQIKLNEEFQ